MKNPFFFICLLFFFCSISNLKAQHSLQKLESVSYSKVKIDDKFWKSRISAVSNVTSPCVLIKPKSRPGVSGISKK